MTRAAKSLSIAAQAAAALGFISISLTQEIATGWLAASGMAWVFSLVSFRYHDVLAGLRRYETIAVAGMVGMLLVDFFILRVSIFIAVTHFLLLFQIVKLIGQKARKDSLQIFLFSFFQILAACTLSVDAWHAGVLLALIPTAAAALFWNQMAREFEMLPALSDAAIHRPYRRLAFFMCLSAIPLNLFLAIGVFILFPRLTLNAPLPGFNGHHSSYTDQVNLAQTGNLAQDATVTLWLSFPRPEERSWWSGYLRGDVLSVFDGRTWSVLRRKPGRNIFSDSNGVFGVGAPRTRASLMHFAITMVDTSAGTLFMIGRALRVTTPLQTLQETEGGALHWNSAWRRPLRYEVISEPFTDRDMLPDHLALPAIKLDRIQKLTDDVAGKGSALDQARRIESYLQKNYRYSTDFGTKIADNPVDYFLFKRKEGPCGHFASAMALMLRLRHIPSRLVAGYHKGEWNEPAKSVIIRQRDAHAWVEAYLEGQGWVSFDPTPAPPPAGGTTTSFAHRFSQYLDYLDLLWNRFVIQYDLYSQIKAFESLKGTSNRFTTGLASWWTRYRARLLSQRAPHPESLESSTPVAGRFPFKEVGVFSFLSAAAILLLIRKRQNSGDATIRFYVEFLSRMTRAGHPKNPAETGREFADRIVRALPQEKETIARITNDYYRLRFSSRS